MFASGRSPYLQVCCVRAQVRPFSSPARALAHPSDLYRVKKALLQPDRARDAGGRVPAAAAAGGAGTAGRRRPAARAQDETGQEISQEKGAGRTGQTRRDKG